MKTKVAGISQSHIRTIKRTASALAFALMSWTNFQPVQADIDLDSLLAETVGGPEAVVQLRSFDSYYLSGDLLLNGQPGESRIWFVAPNLLRHEMDFRQFSIVQAFDGTIAWKQDINGGQSELSGFEKRDLLREIYLQSYSYVVDGRVPGGREYRGLTTVDSLTAHEVWLYPFNTDTIRVFIDTASGHMVLTETRVDNFTARTSQDEFGQFQGITAAAHTRGRIEGMQLEAELTVSEMAFGVEVDRSIFHFGDTSPQPDFRFPPEATAVTVPIEYVQGQLQVLASVNGVATARFILDTGSGTGLFDEDFSNLLSLSVVGSLPFRGVAEHNQIDMVRADSLQLGPLVLFDQLGGSPSLKHIDLHGGRQVFGGVLGYDFFSRFPIEIDFAGGELRIYHPQRATLPEGGLEVPFKFTMQVPVVTAEIGDSKGEFIVDLGNPYDLIVHPHFAADDRLDTYVRDEDRQAGYLQGVGGAVYMTRSALTEFRMGEALYTDVEAIFPKGETGLVGSIEVAGNIGTGLLDDYRVLFDYPGKRLVLFPRNE